MKHIFAQKQYQFEESAQRKFEAYILALQEYFKNTGEDDTFEDIELAIQDKLEIFLSQRADKRITLKDVEDLIQQFGSVEMITQQEKSETPLFVGKKLFRDSDNKIIAGVASGLGHYFGVSPWLVRTAFILALFFPVPSILPYILLWIFVPPTQTKSDKLRMRGAPVSISTLSHDVENYTSRRILSAAKIALLAFASLIVLLISAFMLHFVFHSQDELKVDERQYIFSCNLENSLSPNVFIYKDLDTPDTRVLELDGTVNNLEKSSDDIYSNSIYELSFKDQNQYFPIIKKEGKIVFDDCSLVSIQSDTRIFGVDTGLLNLLREQADDCLDRGGVWDRDLENCVR